MEYNPQNVYNMALTWLTQGYKLLPVVWGQKSFVAGYGPNLAGIESPDKLRRLLDGGRRYNLAVAGRDLYILDFDNPQSFIRWADSAPLWAVQTWTERSPRGYHLFFTSPYKPPQTEFLEGVELKRAAIIAPSQVAGRLYAVVERYPLAAVRAWHELLSGLTAEPIPAPTPAPQHKQKPKRQQQQPQPPAPQTGDDLVTRIKQGINLFEYASGLTELKPSSGGGAGARWWSGRCPLPSHEDKKPSFWVDAERGVWGCHACGVRGDVINLYAAVNGVSVRAALAALAARLAGGGK